MIKRILVVVLSICCYQLSVAQKVKFNDDWMFKVDTSNSLNEKALEQKKWRSVTLPHDWSIELPFDVHSPSGNRGAAVRGGLGMYQKKFVLNNTDKDKRIFIVFDGVYMNSTVWINGVKLGTRPFGYISFEYELTPHLKFNQEENILTVRVENKQPNSRWYSGSGIYRNVWLDTRGKAHVKNWGTYVKTTSIENNRAELELQTEVSVEGIASANLRLNTTVYTKEGKQIVSLDKKLTSSLKETNITIPQKFIINNPQRWSLENPYMYKVVNKVFDNKKEIHTYETSFGIRDFYFHQQKGFFLNGEYIKIIGACMHHDLGALGAAVNTRAMERQLQKLKSMGINGIRTAHNPPAPELLDLCDSMGFIVMNETFDVWTWDKENTPYNYNLYFNEWHQKDLTDHVLRDRNHPSVFMWSIGNEIPEQRTGKNNDTIGRTITRNLVNIIKKLDDRPVTAGLNNTENTNNMYLSGALDILGVNYHHWQWKDLGTELFPGNKPYLLAENTSALATRGSYDMPSDSIRRWAGIRDITQKGNPDYTMSAYENASAPWSSTNEEALKLFLKYPYLSGMYLWTGFDYLGEPTPYPFPARSSYFGILDMAGFPKDSYYLYKSIFTKENVLHILPHWNWTPGQIIDVHVYFNNADEVELFLNNRSLGKKSKQGDDLFVRFNGVTFEPGTLKAVSKKNGKIVMQTLKHTAGEAHKIEAKVDRAIINADGDDLAFVEISLLDKDGNIVPLADNLLHFNISGEGSIRALDNGYQADLEPYSNKKYRKAFHGKALAIIQSTKAKGKISLQISSPALVSDTVEIISK